MYVWATFSIPLDLFSCMAPAHSAGTPWNPVDVMEADDRKRMLTFAADLAAMQLAMP